MIIGEHDTNERVFIIAEIGNNHEGNIEYAKEMIRSASRCGVDAVKFQTFKTELFVNKENTERFAKLKSFELTYDEFRQLAEIAAKEKVLFLSTPFDCKSAKFLEKLVPAYKISSSDNTFYPLIEVVSKTGKPIIISSGLIDLKQIKKTLDYIKSIWRENNFTSDLAVLHCVANYPVEVDDINLLAIKHIHDNIDCVVGYSDHSLGIEAAVASVAFGARIVEKHFTLDKNFSKFRDHQLSANPSEMKEIVRRVRNLERLFGNGEVALQKCEEDIISTLRRSIISVRDLPKGHVLTLDDIAWVRPAGGIPPGKESLIIGKKLNKDVHEGEMILQDYFI